MGAALAVAGHLPGLLSFLLFLLLLLLLLLSLLLVHARKTASVQLCQFFFLF